MKTDDLEKLASWLRCYPVAGREDERKRLTRVVEDEIERMPKRKLDSSDIATTLAALRMFQEKYRDRDADYIRRYCGHFDDGVEPLGTEDIDTLCEEINCGKVEL